MDLYCGLCTKVQCGGSRDSEWTFIMCSVHVELLPDYIARFTLANVAAHLIGETAARTALADARVSWREVG